ncbi:hypothetical protein FB45DRAFT_1029543 [Roridomyces roridus]|uniref:Uncharacterized protein n=1 Tax=Roridomyces roridus TaxID=1738132 RepID=A0AAD7FMF8_9AGAR|nr:hypothetical protein FB45DRAFT_1029543 [Roridomyces roridus]
MPCSATARTPKSSLTVDVADPEASIPVSTAISPPIASGAPAADHRKVKFSFKRARARQAASTSTPHYRDRLHKPSQSAKAHGKIKSKVKRDEERRQNPASTTNPKLKHVHLKRAGEAASSAHPGL